MMNRREALLGMSAAVLSVSGAGAAATQAADDAVDQRLRKDIDRLLPRENSEEGVPVLLACINLVGKSPSARTPFNAAVAAEFRRDAPAWQRIYPKAEATDVGKLIEVFAARDFASSGKEPAS